MTRRLLFQLVADRTPALFEQHHTGCGEQCIHHECRYRVKLLALWKGTYPIANNLRPRYSLGAPWNCNGDLAMSWYGAVPTSSLPANATLYQVRMSTPDDWVMMITWGIWTAAAAVDHVLTGTLIVAVLSIPKVRESTFNLYLAGLVGPDFVSSGGFVSTNTLNLSSHKYVSLAMCKWQGFYATFGIAGSFWMHALVAFELYRLLAATKRLRQFTFPSLRVAKARCLGIYALAAFISAMPSLGMVPVHPMPVRGLVCLPDPASPEEEPFFLLVYLSLFCTIPFTLSMVVALVSWWTGLIRVRDSSRAQPSPSRTVGAEPDLPAIRRAQQARSLRIYFVRLWLVCVMWLPGIGLHIYSDCSILPLTIAISWMLMLNTVAVPLSFAKRDVRGALEDLLPYRTSGRADNSPTELQTPTAATSASSTASTSGATHGGVPPGGSTLWIDPRWTGSVSWPWSVSGLCWGLGCLTPANPNPMALGVGPRPAARARRVNTRPMPHHCHGGGRAGPLGMHGPADVVAPP